MATMDTNRITVATNATVIIANTTMTMILIITIVTMTTGGMHGNNSRTEISSMVSCDSLCTRGEGGGRGEGRVLGASYDSGCYIELVH